MPQLSFQNLLTLCNSVNLQMAHKNQFHLNNKSGYYADARNLVFNRNVETITPAFQKTPTVNMKTTANPTPKENLEREGGC